MNKVIQGDCIEKMRELEENSVDALVSDPPYGLGFMGRTWDEFSPKEYEGFSFDWGKEAYRVLKPGAYLLAFSGTRTYHRMVCGLEDAGFVIKDMINWCYGSGFPKSYDIGKGIDQKLGNKREIIGYQKRGNSVNTDFMNGGNNITKGNTKWEGWGTALKPAHEPIVVAQKPREGTYAENVLKWGVGGLNIDGCRVGYTPNRETDNRIGTDEEWGGKRDASAHTVSLPAVEGMKMYKTKGRFPSNLLLSHHPECVPIGVKNVKSNGHWAKSKVSGYGKFGKGKEKYFGKGFMLKEELIESYDCHPDCPIRLLDEQSGVTKSSKGGFTSNIQKNNRTHQWSKSKDWNSKKYIENADWYTDKGGASRFFYCAKAHKSERNAMNLDDYPVHYKFNEDLFKGIKNPNERKKCKKQEKWIKEHIPFKIITKSQLNELPSKFHKYFTSCKHIYWKKEGDSLREVSLKKYQNLPKNKRFMDNPVSTLKPINVMRWLVRLVCPPNGVVLDPFGGSGTTGIACIIEGFNYILIEKRERFAKVIIPKRLEYWSDPKNWDILKDHNALPSVSKLKNEKVNTSLGEWL